jgi:DNA-binding CsgD family transcriptional regulator
MVAFHAIEIAQDLGSRAVELEIFLRETGNYLQSVSRPIAAIRVGPMAATEWSMAFSRNPCKSKKSLGIRMLFASIEGALANPRPGRTDREAAEAAEPMATLSPRERQVLDALVAGRPSKVIAHDLGISIRTVEVRRARMLERLGTRRLAGAIRLAVLADLAPDRARMAKADLAVASNGPGASPCI